MNQFIQRINTNIEPLRQQIIKHELYQHIDDLPSLRIFMKHHVFAVWDFMSLLKTLQNNLTCTTVPWFPVGKADTRFLINEIVVGEESDVDMEGNRTSHFELYLQAMRQSGADVNQINVFGKELLETGSFELAFSKAEVSDTVKDFVDYTFSVIDSKKAHVHAAVFTFGREDLIPSMFIALVDDLSNKLPERVALFKYYLDRHIEIDGDHHSQLAMEMTSILCGDNEDYWQEAEVAIYTALQKRLGLWDGALAEIKSYKKQATPQFSNTAAC